MKTVHLVAVSVAAALALGAGFGFGFATWHNQNREVAETSTTTSSASSTTKAPIQSQTNTDGPWNRDLVIATGARLSDLSEPKTFVERAGVPTLIQRTDGSLLSAFQWFPDDNDEAFDEVAVSTSTDEGSTWSDPEPIVVNGLPDGYQRPFDPTLVLRNDGSVYLYFTTSTEAVPGPNQSTIIAVASSTDGVNYTYLGDAFSQDGTRLYDSSVVFWGDSWYMGTPHAPELGQYRGTSTDGLMFTRGTDVATTGLNWTGNFATVDGTVYFFGTASPATDAQAWYVTSADMETWSNPISLNVQMGDPAAVLLDDGTWIVIGVSGPVRSESNPSQK